MDVLSVMLDLIAALFWPRRSRAGAPGSPTAPQTIRDMLRAFSQSVAPPQPAPPQPSVSAAPGVAPADFAVAPPARDAGVPPATAQAGIVAALFANPPSLVGAFIVAEALAKPVALRDP